MTWGVTCMSDGEMIEDIECNRNDNYISDSLHKYNQELKDRYAYFKMTLASTGSTIELTFDEIELTALGSIKSHNAPPPLYPRP